MPREYPPSAFRIRSKNVRVSSRERCALLAVAARHTAGNMTRLMRELTLGQGAGVTALRLELKEAVAKQPAPLAREWRGPHNFGLSVEDLDQLQKLRIPGQSEAETIRRLIGLSEISPWRRKAARARSRRDHTRTLSPTAVAAYWELIGLTGSVNAFLTAHVRGTP